MWLLYRMLSFGWVFKMLALICKSKNWWASYLFVSETGLQRSRVTKCSGVPGMKGLLGCRLWGLNLGDFWANQDVSHSIDPLRVIVSQINASPLPQRPEHLLVSRFPQIWKGGGLMVRRGAQRTEDSFQGHMEWSKTSPGISQLVLVTQQKLGAGYRD